MKIGTDGTLLGAWCNCNNAQSILDIGTGTGLIALMLAQRNSTAIIDAIELDKASAEEAQFNFEKSNWSERLTIYCSSFQEFETTKTYDLIVSNPPFFSNSSKNPKTTKSNTRHNDSLPFEVFIEKSKKLLEPKGELSVILPIDESVNFIDLCKKQELYLNRKTEVYSNINSDQSFRYLMTFSSQKKVLTEDHLIVETETRHQFTEEYKLLCKDFFLKF